MIPKTPTVRLLRSFLPLDGQRKRQKKKPGDSLKGQIPDESLITWLKLRESCLKAHSVGAQELIIGIPLVGAILHYTGLIDLLQIFGFIVINL
jgi:hypothetical protein